jgi:hypothetical protein
MAGMAAPPSSAPAGLPRRRFLAASAAGLALLAAGCTSSPAAPARDRVTDRQADALAAQVPVQETVVAAYRAAAAADPALAARVAVPQQQAADQLARLRAAAPGATTSPSPSSASASASAPAAAVPAGAVPAAWLHDQVQDAADSHAAACLGQSGARAALLGSIAAGLRGQAGQLA